jgi:hypothetical protein
MAPSLTAAEILARRKNYASSFKNRASVYNKENKMPAAAKEEALNQKGPFNVVAVVVNHCLA